MLGGKPQDPAFNDTFKLSIRNYSDTELQDYTKKNIEDAAVFMKRAANSINPTGGHTAQGFASIHQNWAIIRQNELLLRQGEQTHQQNERIIQLLESMASAQGVTVPVTCPSCNSTATDGTAFCSQCGHKLTN